MSDQRTLQQNKALHKYFRQLADALNFAGLDMKATLSHRSVDVPWNVNRIKEALWKDLQMIMTKSDEYPEGKDSTIQLDTKEVSEIYETLNRWTASKLGVSVPFPSIDEQIKESQVKE